MVYHYGNNEFTIYNAALERMVKANTYFQTFNNFVIKLITKSR